MVESEFKEVLQATTSVPEIFALAKYMLNDCREFLKAQAGENKRILKQKQRDIEKKTFVLVKRVVDTNNQSLISAYQQKFEPLEKNKRVIQKQLLLPDQSKDTFEDTFRITPDPAIADPLRLCWQPGNNNAGKYDMAHQNVESSNQILEALNIWKWTLSNERV